MRYSDTWFDTFLLDGPPATTAAELDFLRRQLPRPVFSTVLDVCCGAGRHARGLAASGYRVTGVDINDRVLAVARDASSGDAQATADPVSSPAGRGVPLFALADVRALPFVGPFDAVVLLWQSFGAYDESTNRSILKGVRAVLRDRGRFILDIYDRRFFEAHQGERSRVHAGRSITECKVVRGERLHVELRYDSSEIVDRYDWHVYTPDEIAEEAAAAGFRTVLRCARFDEAAPADASAPRMQIVFEA